MYFVFWSFWEIVSIFFVFGILGEGILYISSWIKPTAHKKAQIARPKSVPKSKSNPVIKIGAFPEASVFWIAPSGHEEIAPGQE